MTDDQMRRLQPGDVVRGKGRGESYIVTGNYGERVTAVRTADITNPAEWDVIFGPQEGRLDFTIREK